MYEQKVAQERYQLHDDDDDYYYYTTAINNKNIRNEARGYQPLFC